MAWQDESIPTLRVLLGDVDEAAQIYSDDSLESTLVVAAKQVLAVASFPTAYAASVANVTLSPDPTTGSGQDDAFVNLFTLKAAAILDRTEASLAARRGIVVKDGTSAIDLSKVADAKIRLLKLGWNAVFDDALFEYKYQRTNGVCGAAVLTPFRLFAWDAFGGTSAFGAGRR